MENYNLAFAKIFAALLTSLEKFTEDFFALLTTTFSLKATAAAFFKTGMDLIAIAISYKLVHKYTKPFAKRNNSVSVLVGSALGLSNVYLFFVDLK